MENRITIQNGVTVNDIKKLHILKDICEFYEYELEISDKVYYYKESKSNPCSYSAKNIDVALQDWKESLEDDIQVWGEELKFIKTLNNKQSEVIEMKSKCVENVIQKAFSELNEIVNKRGENAEQYLRNVIEFEKELNDCLGDALFTGDELNSFSMILGDAQLCIDFNYIDSEREVFLTFENKRVPNTVSEMIDDDYIRFENIILISNNRLDILNNLVNYLNELVKESKCPLANSLDK